MSTLFLKQSARTLLLALMPLTAGADSLDLRDYSLLDTGMSQAEVEYRVGPPDRESVLGDGIHGPTRIIWYYIPASANGWISEIIFDSHGRIRDLKRYKP
ncbi:hypothetical protein J2T55_000730 [Methylohalomonas lacus]|uniref:Lipoprotein SmpA/OmlA domain-containing protein n=1 Tax=Methylohalomonas lacus TaxID=398773 RepID=A0AAE3L167_9GAMM|nr:hypothetical protein [Methylohalomonas lacus]MCS3902726.1 hypothetical protein [Methylohalomonas lacus]